MLPTRPWTTVENPELVIAFGLVLVGLTLYTSTLSYALRIYSRARLVERLSDERRHYWVRRLDQYESEVQVVSSLARLILILALTIWGYVVFQPSGGWKPPYTLSAVVTPTAIVFLLLLVFAIGVPNALALHAGEAILARSLGLLWAMRAVLYPFEKLLIVIEWIVCRLLGKSGSDEEDEAERIEQEVREVVSEGELQGALDEGQKEMIESVFGLHDTEVSEIMTPRTEIVAIAVEDGYSDVREIVVKHGHSRIPVFEDTLDHIVGVLYAKDLIRLESLDAFDVRKVMREASYVPESKTIDHLLREFRQGRVHIAIVLDEYGGTAGLVTIEDILEELVGEIDDEFDQDAAPSIERIDEQTLEVDARVHIHEINEELTINLPDDGDYETIGGFLFSAMGKIPTSGEEFQRENVQFSIVDAGPRKINRLRIHVEAPSNSD